MAWRGLIIPVLPGRVNHPSLGELPHNKCYRAIRFQQVVDS
jgi:hypothetical protein